MNIKDEFKALAVKLIRLAGSKTFWTCVILTITYFQPGNTMTLVEYISSMLVINGVFQANDLVGLQKAKSIPTPVPPAKEV